ncbi:MAG TPA: ABC transporter ATP-binding protein [Erysipelotrichaceae bacterium]|nr:ABC transporter ATP-binding protein [Erysipelotrichaceae bacterium]HQB31916.1 ABC transporter ATP-binding protein [Erysipelotrichaceae bacterium]
MSRRGRNFNYEKPENINATLRRLLTYVSDKMLLIGLVLVLVMSSSVLSIYAVKLVEPIINEGIIPLIGKEITSESLAVFVRLLVILGIVSLLSALFEYISAKIMARVTNNTLNRIRNELFSKMQKLPLSYFDRYTHGELMAHYTSDVGVIREAISQGITTFLSSIITIVGVFIMMLSYSVMMTLVVMALLGLTFLVILLFAKKSMNNFKAQQATIAVLNGYMEEMMNGQKVVKVFVHENRVRDEFFAVNEKARKASTKANIYAGIVGPISNNMSHVNYAVCSILGAYLCIIGRMNVGRLASFLMYSRNISHPLSRVTQNFNALISAIAGAERIFKAIDTKEEIDEGKVTLVPLTFDLDNSLLQAEQRTGLWAWKKPDGELVRLRGDVRFIDVDFSYDGKKQVLNNVSFYAKPGQKIAFVGATGAGKTTITNLINRFYDIQAGQILYDGIDVREIEKDSLRRSLSFVLQDTHLFTGTVMDNIRYGKLDATDEQCIKAARLANANEFIEMLPEGYNTVLTGDGANLSQGQRQLLSIARAAVADAPVLVLDEATSSIDTRTEKLIEEGMDNLMAGRTVFVIAHRLSTVRNSNAIVVLDNGEIIERGSHSSLLKQRGQYYKLYTGQFELD